MRIFSVSLAGAALCFLLTGCSLSDLADNNVLTQARQYFPAAEISHRSQGVLQVDTHVGNISELFAAKVMSQLLNEHRSELQFLGLAGYQALAILFDNGQCGWNTQWEWGFVCRTSGAPVHNYSFYGTRLGSPNNFAPAIPPIPPIPPIQ